MVIFLRQTYPALRWEMAAKQGRMRIKCFVHIDASASFLCAWRSHKCTRAGNKPLFGITVVPFDLPRSLYINFTFKQLNQASCGTRLPVRNSKETVKVCLSLRKRQTPSKSNKFKVRTCIIFRYLVQHCSL